MPLCQIRGRHPSGCQDWTESDALRSVAAPLLRGRSWSVRLLTADDPPPPDWVLELETDPSSEADATQVRHVVTALSRACPGWAWAVVFEGGASVFRAGLPVDETFPQEELPDGFFPIGVDYTFLEDNRPITLAPADDEEPLPRATGACAGDALALLAATLTVEPLDKDGDHPVSVSLTVRVGPGACVRVGARALLRDGHTVLKSVELDKEGPFEPGQVVSLTRTRWVRGPLPPGATFALWGLRHDGEAAPIGVVRPTFAAPDADGDVRATLFVEVDAPGPPWDHATLHLETCDDDGTPTGATRDLSVGPLPGGRAPIEAGWWLRKEEASQVGQPMRAHLRASRTQAWRWLGDPLPSVRLGAPAAPPPAASPPPAPAARAPAARPAPSAAAEVEAALTSGDPARIVAACDRSREIGLKAVAPRLRSLLGDAHPEVRAAAVTALVALAGPSMLVAVRRLQQDPDPTVRAAADAAVAAWTTR